MNTTETYTKDGLLNPLSKNGNVEALNEYVFNTDIDVINDKDHGDFYIQKVISVVNKYRMDLRQKAMAVYGD
ncbi:hypothetical protein [Morganella phage phiA020]